MRAARGVLTMLLLPVMGCTVAGGGGEAEAEASCAYVVTYRGHAYVGAEHGDFEVGERIGTAAKPPCDDTPGDDDPGTPPTTLNAYRVVGWDTAEAIAVGSSADDVVFTRVDPDLELP
ncbi:DUF6281 family protein [Streptomyces sp. MN13]